MSKALSHFISAFAMELKNTGFENYQKMSHFIKKIIFVKLIVVKQWKQKTKIDEFFMPFFSCKNETFCCNFQTLWYLLYFFIVFAVHFLKLSYLYFSLTMSRKNRSFGPKSRAANTIRIEIGMVGLALHLYSQFWT